MKAYLKSKRREKESNVRKIQDLIDELGKLYAKSTAVDSCVKGVVCGIANGLKGDNSVTLRGRASKVNKEHSNEILKALRLANQSKSKVLSEIDDINRKITNIEQEEQDNKK